MDGIRQEDGADDLTKASWRAVAPLPRVTQSSGAFRWPF